MEGSGQIDPEEVEEGDDDENVAAPVVDVPDEPPEQEAVPEREDRIIGPLRRGFVGEQQQDPRPR